MSQPAAASASAAPRRPLSPGARTDDDANRPVQRARVNGGDVHTAMPSPTSARPLTQPTHSLAQRSAVDQTDALHCMLAFLPLNDVPLIVQTCRAWQHAAMKAKCRNVPFRAGNSAQRIDSVLRSPLLSLHVRDLDLDFSGFAGHSIPALIMRVAAELPLLAKLRVTLETRQLPLQNAQLRAHFVENAFSPRLTSLQLFMFNADSATMQLLVDALPSAVSLQRLHLAGVSYESGQFQSVVFTPLLQLRSLHTFTQATKLLSSQCAVLKQRPSLRALCFVGCQTSCADSNLLTQPHQLSQLTVLEPVSDTWFMADMELIAAQLPALTRVRPKSFATSAISLLPRLAHLRSLRLNVFHPSPVDDTPIIVSALRAMPSLSELEVNLESTLQRAQLPTMLSALPRLQSLIIDGGGLSVHKVITLDSLDFLAAVPQLTQLRLGLQVDLFAAQLLSLGITLPRVRHLTLERASILLPPFILEQLVPPSAVLPELRRLQVGQRVVQMAGATDD